MDKFKWRSGHKPQVIVDELNKIRSQKNNRVTFDGFAFAQLQPILETCLEKPDALATQQREVS